MFRVKGNETTRRLMTNVINGLRTVKPSTPCARYVFSNGENSRLITQTQGDTFRRVSIVRIGKVKAVINNSTGAMLISKPFSTWRKNALSAILEFLEAIQPEKLSKERVVDSSFRASYDFPASGSAPTTSCISEVFNTGIKRIIVGFRGIMQERNQAFLNV